jgi:hypothetical protein
MKIASAMLVVSIVVASPQPLAAQPARTPTENVTVTGTKSREVWEKFVESLAAPARMTGKIARWEEGVCPLTVGLRPEFTKFVTKRVRDVAALAGAPVSADASCTPNLQILFSAHPQILLDNIRKKHPQFLGYYDNSAQLKDLATVTRPIQAWYMTGTKDLHGQILIDGKPAGLGVQMHDALTGQEFFFPNAKISVSSGTRLDDGLRSIFYRVTIVADPTKLVDYEIGSIADYISLLALTQLNAPDTCQQLPSIVNMLAAGCERKVDALTDNDIAYLRGLYKMSPNMTLRIQQDEIAYQMEQGANK